VPPAKRSPNPQSTVKVRFHIFNLEHARPKVPKKLPPRPNYTPINTSQIIPQEEKENTPQNLKEMDMEEIDSNTLNQFFIKRHFE
jgi:hypothetical protein